MPPTSTRGGGDFADVVTPHAGTETLGLLSTDTSQEVRQRTLPLRELVGDRRALTGPQGTMGARLPTWKHARELLPRQDTERVTLS